MEGWISDIEIFSIYWLYCLLHNAKPETSFFIKAVWTGKASLDPYTCKLRRLFITDFFCLFQHLDIIFYVSFRERRNNVQKMQIDTFLPARHTNTQGYRVTGKSGISVLGSVVLIGDCKRNDERVYFCYSCYNFFLEDVHIQEESVSHIL